MKARRVLFVGAAITLLGLALAAASPVGAGASGGGQQVAGGIGVLVGWALLGWGIHSFGRSGSSAA